MSRVMGRRGVSVISASLTERSHFQWGGQFRGRDKGTGGLSAPIDFFLKGWAIFLFFSFFEEARERERREETRRGRLRTVNRGQSRPWGEGKEGKGV